MTTIPSQKLVQELNICTVHLCITFVAGGKSVWNVVQDMEDKVPIKYEVIEELFCQRNIVAAPKEEQKQIKPKEV